MNLHEYQAKQIFAEYQLPVGKGYACKSADEAADAIKNSMVMFGSQNAKFTQVGGVKPVV